MFVHASVQSSQHKNLTVIFYSDREKEGEWRNYYTKESVDLSLGENVWSSSREWNCAHSSGTEGWKGWKEFGCFVPELFTCACQHPKQMYLHLRGLCPGSHFDRFYVPRNEEGSGSVQLLGIKTSVIKHNGLSWQMEDSGWIVSKNTTAISEAPFSSFVLGSQNWTITNDNKTCSTKGESYRRRLKLTGCLVGNFTCDDGQCIRSYKLSHVSKIPGVAKQLANFGSI